MLDDKARRALAVELINEIFSEWDSQGRPWQIFADVSKAGEASPVAVYSCRIEGHGAYICQHWPLEPVEKIISGCEQIFDNKRLKVESTGEVLLDFKDTEWEPDFRDKAIREMAAFAVHNYLLGMSARLEAAIKEGVEESLFLADAALLNDVAADNDLKDGRGLTVEARDPLEQFVKGITKRKRELLVGLLGALPRVITKGRAGRPLGSTKSEEAKADERKQFEARIEEALRGLISDSRIVPTKTDVAKRLGVGGFNPDTGNESFSQALNNKLRRLGINYDELLLRVLSEFGLNK